MGDILVINKIMDNDTWVGCTVKDAKTGEVRKVSKLDMLSAGKRLINAEIVQNSYIRTKKGYTIIPEELVNKILKICHASRTGIQGIISPFVGHDNCDFGRGFYCGVNEEQPLKLVAFEANPVLYTFELDTSNLKIKSIKLDLEWLLIVANNRGKIENKYQQLKDKIDSSIQGFDVIHGVIADDRLFSTLSAFFDGLISDRMAIKLLDVMSYGFQYTLKTDKACKALKTINEKTYDIAGLAPFRNKAIKEKEDAKKAVEEMRSKLFELGGSAFKDLLDRGIQL